MIKTFEYQEDFRLESGEMLAGISIGYHTYGSLNSDKSNVIWACHAFSANSDVCEWWKGLFGQGYLFNPENHFIVCANFLGSCYGTTGPLSVNPTTGQPWYRTFPLVTLRDLVKAHIILAKSLGIEQLDTLIGGSLGGQQALEWAIIEPKRIKHLIILAANAKQSPWAIAFNESQRLAILADKSFKSDTIGGGTAGLCAARSIALLSYRTYGAYDFTQSEDTDEKLEDFRAASYQRYQGDKLVKRFNAYSYFTITNTIDSHNVGRGRTSVLEALKQIQAQTLVLGFEKDVLFPKEEQEYLVNNISGANFEEVPTRFGHDGFLLETEAIPSIIRKYRK